MSACIDLKVRQPNQTGTNPLPPVIYVRDFTFSAGAFRHEGGLLPINSVAPGPLGATVPRMFGIPEDSASRARELVDLMSQELKEDLANAGFPVRRLRPDEPPPAQGWLVRGTFTDLNEGNRLGRALLGLGAGRTHFQIFVFLDELSPQGAEGKYALNMSAASSRTPGAIFSFSPIVAVGRYVSCSIDLDRSVLRAASRVSRQIADTIRDQPG